MQNKITVINSMLQHEAAGITGMDFDDLRRQLTVLKKEVNKVVKSTPGAELTACNMGTSRQEYIDEAKRLVGVAAAGSKKAADHTARLLEICDEQSELWIAKKAAVKREAAARIKAFSDRQEVYASRHNEIVAMFDARLQELSPACAADGTGSVPLLAAPIVKDAAAEGKR